ncbi:MAG: transglutaminase-like domain-containing protein [Planctomycetes bacterium]|nr:transglutaminase-like domain-containing protein [Planctomycetota bacterium]
MSIPEPKHCKADAHAYFAAQMPVVNTARGLLRAAIGLSMHQMDGIDPPVVETKVARLADRVRTRVRGNQPQALVAHLHDVLFEEEQFAGNSQDYHNPFNSYIPAVLESRRGLPITLTLIYKCVAEQVGLKVHGLNAPGHFLAAVDLEDERMIIDPFYSGESLSRDEAFERIRRVTGEMKMDESFLPVATHRQWLARMLGNLQGVFEQQGEERDVAAMLELRYVLEGHI